MVEEKIIYQGAEAKIVLSEYLARKVIQKRRLHKRYRIKEIDEKLISTRTKEEAKLMAAARRQGVAVPIIYDVDLKQGIITMEYLDGSRIKDIFNSLKDEERKKLCYKIGESIAKLHNGDIIHGDITTSNMILYEDKIHFIDFGLGEINSEVEAKGVDLHLLMEAIASTHARYIDSFNYVMLGYQDFYKGDINEIERKIDDVIRRGRYR
ncbi:MAG TPA: Kae1-associated serine/threonine protein kinase [Thermoplasmatales archaeon]|nr:Kae1-associated serine/threonine protein kinase [Thermoplasmatales archaeon]